MKNKRNYFKEKGITLIALVVTIVVLLILAGVTINAVFSDSGIIKKAQEAQDKANESVQKDMEQINALENWLNEHTSEEVEIPEVNLNGYVAGTWTNKDIIINLSSKNINDGKYQYSNDETTWVECTTTITINTDQENTYYFKAVDKNGKESKVTQGYVIKRDTKEPTFKYDIKQVDHTNYVTYEITNISDEGSGVENTPEVILSYKVNSNYDENDRNDESGYTTIYTGTSLNGKINVGKSYGYCYVMVEIKDKAGNVGKLINSPTLLLSTDEPV